VKVATPHVTRHLFQRQRAFIAETNIDNSTLTVVTAVYTSTVLFIGIDLDVLLIYCSCTLIHMERERKENQPTTSQPKEQKICND
jgi:hypothetical protein